MASDAELESIAEFYAGQWAKEKCPGTPYAHHYHDSFGIEVHRVVCGYWQQGYELILFFLKKNREINDRSAAAEGTKTK